MPSRESLEQCLSEFDAETVGAVLPPGADAVRRAVHRRERRRTMVAASAAVVAVLSVIGLTTVARPRPSVVIPGPAVSTAAPPTTPARSSSSTSPTAGPTSAAVRGPLRVSGPSSVTLHTDGTVYRGQFTLTVTNTGPPYTDTIVYLTTPAGIWVDFPAGDPGFGACMGATAPEIWTCTGPSIPSGGTVHPVIHLRADYGPQTSDLVLPGFAMRYTVESSPPPPGDRVTMTVVLAGT
jgi:hypothetical protein